MKGAAELSGIRRVRPKKTRVRVRNRDVRRRRELGGQTFLPHLSDGFKERDDRCIHIGRVPERVKSKDDVAAAFAAFGTITHIHLQPDLKFGFVHFEEEHSAQTALDQQFVEVMGSRVQVRTATRPRRGDHSAPADAGAAPTDAEMQEEEEEVDDEGLEEEALSEVVAGDDPTAPEDVEQPPEEDAADPMLE
eukprot:CAMPEP_0204538730 /NCGR_PEP_ID=MMETSP0661-20131031/16229_1 /ASSEMBLY_ACC=CAM_ASM_000606 /TAXON_ID=109239 /ORGANISM="Alexandrium margalefi, Strain AMGDE01CS-322" /LENGTH=191 /DNA_ID=CAMNT_0051545325 /DNA_START=45 /DNA_END=617 /DNA_ORIENTATION=+